MVRHARDGQAQHDVEHAEGKAVQQAVLEIGYLELGAYGADQHRHDIAVDEGQDVGQQQHQQGEVSLSW